MSASAHNNFMILSQKGEISSLQLQGKCTAWEICDRENGRWAKVRMGEEEEWRDGAKGGLWGWKHIWSEEFLSNYQSLRNAATALTRQAAAWLQQLFNLPTCITNFTDLCTVDAGTHVYKFNKFSHIAFGYFLQWYCCLFLSLSLQYVHSLNILSLQ